MGIFEYLGVLISVIMGLGITHLAVGASKLVQNRDRCKPYITHSLWSLAVLLYILIVWWGMYWWSKHVDWRAYQYLFITLYALTLFFLSALLYPYDMDKDIDVEAYFFKQRRWFFSVFIIAWLLDIPETLSKGQTALREVPPDYLVFVISHISICVVGLITENRAVHVALPIIWMTATLVFIGSSTMSIIAN
jgi:hypothetical protein